MAVGGGCDDSNVSALSELFDADNLLSDPPSAIVQKFINTQSAFRISANVYWNISIENFKGSCDN